jgi:DNA-binding NarL/FixJ family response regulator
MAGSQVTVLCVDDRNLVRECVGAVLEQEGGVRVAAEARTVNGALDRFIDARPNVTLVGLHPRGLDGLETIRAIRRVDPRARLLVYAEDETDAVYLALEAGAAGFVLGDATGAELVRVITAVHGRNAAVLDDIKGKLGARGDLPTLTTREVELLELLTQGLRTKAIAATLRISDHTVKVHTKSVYEKLGVHGRAAALAEALRHGFVRLAADRQGPTVRRRRSSPRDRRPPQAATAGFVQLGRSLNAAGGARN